MTPANVDVSHVEETNASFKCLDWPLYRARRSVGVFKNGWVLELFLSAALLMLLERVCLTPELQPINPNFRQS